MKAPVCWANLISRFRSDDCNVTRWITFTGVASRWSRWPRTPGIRLLSRGPGRPPSPVRGNLRGAGTVTIFERRDLAGGLSTYGIISLREPVEVALAEVTMIQQLGVVIETGVELGRDVQLAELQQRFDMVVLSIGLGRTPGLGIAGEEYMLDGLEYVEGSKIAAEPLVVGRQVVVIGAGNTAIDCATIARRLGAERVSIVYRRSEREMTAYRHEYEFAKQEGIEFRFLAQPVEVVVEDGQVAGLVCTQMKLGAPDASGRARAEPVAGSGFLLAADQIVKAIGQQKPALAARLGLKSHNGFIDVDGNFETSLPGVFAIGDCVRSRGNATTVMAVQDGKMAAAVLHARLTADVTSGKGA